MLKFYLCLILFCISSYNVEACIVPQKNTVSISGPSTVCQNQPIGTFKVNYTTAPDVEDVRLTLRVKNGQPFNVQTTSIPVLTSPFTCGPSFNVQLFTECSFTQNYDVPMNCIGGLNFESFFSLTNPNCDEELSIVATLIGSNSGTLASDEFIITPDLSCFTDDSDNLNLRTLQLNGNEASINEVDIFPNPSIKGTEVNVIINNKFKNCTVKLFDINGKIVNQYYNVNQHLTVTTSNLHEKMYMVQIISENGHNFIEKLVLK